MIGLSRLGVRPAAFVRALVAASALAPAGLAQDPPGFRPPPGFAAEGPASGETRTYVQKLANGDRLRLTVLAAPGAAASLDDLAKTAATQPGDQPRDETRQELTSGALTGVAYSCLGASELVEGVPFTRYRRVMAFRLGEGAPFAARADVLAREARPAQSTLEAMAKALAAWQTAIGGDATPPPDPAGDPASRPARGGMVAVTLVGGGDLELSVPAAWGRADLKPAEGREQIYLGPARDVLAKLTVESLGVDKDRLGPYLLVERFRSDTFKDLVDQQLLDIADSLLADYVAQQAEAGVTLTVGTYDEGTLGTRVAVTAPFEETRASGTKHKGRLVAMLHRGFLVLVTASHPVEGYEQGWPDLAAALDTLLFTGEPEPDPSLPDSRPEGDPSTRPATDATRPEDPAAVRETPGPVRLAPAPADWTRDAQGGLKSARVPVGTPLTFRYPASWTLLGEASRETGLGLLRAVPDVATAHDPARSSLRVEYRGFVEPLFDGDPVERLRALMKLRLRREAGAAGRRLTLRPDQRATVDGLAAAVVPYALSTPGGDTSGSFVGVTFDGAVALLDFRIAAGDAATLDPIAADVVNSLTVDRTETIELRRFGPFEIPVPSDWTVEEHDNRAEGKDIFLKGPSGVDLRFQTARQSRPELVTPDVLRKVSHGFLVEGLRVLTAQELADAKGHAQLGARPTLRFESAGPQLDVLVVVGLYVDQLVYALRAAPVGYRGRDLGVAFRMMRAFRRVDAFVVGGPTPPTISRDVFSERVVFERTELDDVAPDGSLRTPSSLYVAFLPDGQAGILLRERGATRDLRGRYRVEADGVVLESDALGRREWRFADGRETLIGDDGDVLFRARRHESP
ncbi:MAG TPA: hypothetical protein VEI02_01700 [Planctomycetota bacterium]|nr:hypothetical protein [Planctomycetota bacterium]